MKFLPKTKLIGYIIFLAASITFPYSALARIYKVELIVFRHEQSMLTNTDNVLSIKKINEKKAKYIKLERKAATIELNHELDKLNTIFEKLILAGNQIIHTISWTQASLPWSEAPIISIGNENSILRSGFIRIYATALLFADIELLFSPQPISAGIFGQNKIPNPEYYISEKRRLKLKEIHYFDHPRFGAILTVSPTEEEQAK